MEKENGLLIIDEKKGRGIAKKMGLKITGLLGVVLRAKELGILSKIAPIIEKLEKVEFRISTELKKQILDLAGEL